MIRMFIHRRAQKSHTENRAPITSLPKTLTGFYIKYAMRGQWPMIICWFLVLAWQRTSMVLVPLTQKWFVAMFERPMTGVEQFMLENIPMLLLIVAIQASYTLGGALRDVIAARRHAVMGKQISEVMTDYMQHQSMQYWSEHKTGSVNSQIGYVSRGIDVMADVLQIVMMFVTICVNVWLMLDINVWITVVFGVIFVSRLIYTILMMKPVKKSAKDASESNSHLSGQIVDSLSNSYIVRLFAGADAEHRHLMAPRADRVRKHIKSRFMQVMMWAPFGFVWDIGYGIVLAICLYLFATGQMILSAVVFAISVYDHVTGAISSLVNAIPRLVDDISTSTDAYAKLAVPLDIVDKPGATDLAVTHGKIEFRNVSFKYKRKWILRNFNLTIKPGERVGLVGASGAGKTTLVHLLMRQWDIKHGQILIDGIDIRDVTQDSLHRAIGYIPQEPTLFDRSLRDNICYGKPDATDAEMRRAARRASADKFIMSTDKKYDSLVGERGIKLSGGQKQRVAIARAFLKDAPILVLDEATSALDSETEVAIQQSFEELAIGRTTIAIVHRLSTLRNMNRIVVMRNGQIIEQGTHRGLLRKKDGEYAKLWKMQSGGFLTEE